MFKNNPPTMVVAGYVLAIFALFAVTGAAFASDAAGGMGGTGMPWEGPLLKLQRSVSGPVAFVIALLGIIASGATLIWGGEISQFARSMIYLVLVICIVVFANTMLTGALFAGAVVPDAGLPGLKL
ncbi:TrbC/VirB2 family protein [Nitrosospira sp. NpAV]|mgnify:CR=1 FL=1|uniref:TrbC/VirB2 family protein n=1 Tax=Nitrosospira sp. NpAV TaxID=58133 RepID=UPI0005A233B1|nr:TrbC/VirB2 family protein [Nitrosospira sp. NpAV]KIO48649.1 conjugal transfer protein TrbC [Nitrosospira sp. NpAV]